MHFGTWTPDINPINNFCRECGIPLSTDFIQLHCDCCNGKIENDFKILDLTTNEIEDYFQNV
jgi:predicted amidophosphoribosyltransferase